MKLLHETDVRAETHRTKVRESLDRIHRDLLSAYEVLARELAEHPDSGEILNEHYFDVKLAVETVETLLDQLKPGSVEKGRRGHHKDGTAAAGKLIPPAAHTAEAQTERETDASDTRPQLPPA